jgi:hypothetical protein
LYPQKFGCTPKNEGKRVHVPPDEKTCGHAVQRVIYDVIVRHFQFLPCIFIQKRKIFKKFYRSHFINNIAKIFTHKKNNSKIVLSKKFYDN